MLQTHFVENNLGKDTLIYLTAHKNFSRAVLRTVRYWYGLRLRKKLVTDTIRILFLNDDLTDDNLG